MNTNTNANTNTIHINIPIQIPLSIYERATTFVLQLRATLCFFIIPLAEPRYCQYLKSKCFIVCRKIRSGSSQEVASGFYWVNFGEVIEAVKAFLANAAFIV